MKKYFLLWLLPLLFACQSDMDKPYHEVDRLKAENQELLDAANENEESINAMVRSLNEIEENLALIKEKESAISVKTTLETEFPEDQKEKIIEDIQFINGLMIENRQKIAWLKQELNKSNIRIDEFEKLVARLALELEEKEIEITELKDELSLLQIDYKVLAVASMEQAELIGMQIEELNTAFYCYGTFKELKEQGVVTKEGGFIGIGRTEKLTEDFNKRYFTRVDITETSEIDILSKKAKLVTSHPSDSYEWKGSDNKVDKLLISDHDKFWSASKYLVIITE